MPISENITDHLIYCKLCLLKSLKFWNIIEACIFSKHRSFFYTAENFLYLKFASKKFRLCAWVSILNSFLELLCYIELLFELVVIFNPANLFSNCEVFEIWLSNHSRVNCFIVLKWPIISNALLCRGTFSSILYWDFCIQKVLKLIRHFAIVW